MSDKIKHKIRVHDLYVNTNLRVYSIFMNRLIEFSVFTTAKREQKKPWSLKAATDPKRQHSVKSVYNSEKIKTNNALSINLCEID